jgi:predicted transcriptional regulator of viral defense system
MESGVILLTSSLPLDIKEMLIKFFDSVNQMEVLFLFLENQNSSWTAESVYKELRSNLTSAGIQLAHLHRCGFIYRLENGSYVFNQKSTLAPAVKKLHEVYQEKPVAVISYIYERPQNKLKEFADAFKIKKDN